MSIWFSVLSNDIIDFRTDKPYKTSLEAAKITVEYIMQNYPPPYNLMVSGGVDSQAMIYAWKLYGKDYIPVSVKYNENLNEHDLETLAIFAENHHIDVTYIDFDLLDFYETNYHSLCEKYKCTSPHFGAHLGMTEHLCGTVLFSGDRLSLDSAAIGKNNLCMLEAGKTRNIVPYFFMHTPEIAYSAIYDCLDLITKPTPPQKKYDLKCEIWKRSGFPVIPQDKKYTGFEKIKGYYDEHFKRLVTPLSRLRYARRPSKRPYDLLLRYPYEDKYGTQKFNFLINKFDIDK